MVESLTQKGIAALKQGEKARARALLQEATTEDPQDTLAWLWLSGAVETPEEKLDCFLQVLRADPNNPSAAKGIMQMINQGVVVVRTRQQDAPDNDPGEDGKSQIAEQETVRGTGPLFSVRPSLAEVGIRGLVMLLVLVFVGIFLLTTVKGFLLTISLLFFIPLFLAGVLVFFLGLAVYMFTLYTLTPQHLVVQTGILGRSRKTIPVQRIQDVAYHQGWLERILGIGDVIVESAGEMGAIRLRDLRDCHRRTQQILALLS